MPHRTPKGRVLRPQHTEGWYWHHELKAARQAGLIDRVEWREWWEYQPSCDCAPPFRAIADLYRHRLDPKVGKNSPQGRALKLVYNSTYGKMAQSVGRPMFSNPVYASLITAGCRTMILEAISTHPGGTRAVLMVATDGVYFTDRHPTLTVDPGSLGVWDETELHDLSLFKPGVYWHKGVQRAVIKSRGANEAALGRVIDRLDAQWRTRRRRTTTLPAKATEVAWWPSTSIAVPFSVVSPRLALHRNRWEQCGAIDTEGVTVQSSWPHIKRNPVPPAGESDRLAHDVLGGDSSEGPYSPAEGFYRSSPHYYGAGHESTPYDRRFGLELEQHGWLSELTTPDGPMDLTWSDLLGEP
jgi:hypothetical protein